MTSLEVRPAVVADVEKLTVIWHEHMHDLAKLDRRFRITEDAPAHYRDDLQAWLGREDARILVAERDGRLIGFVVGWRIKRPPVQTPETIGLISDLCVDGHARQGGVGSALLDGLRGWFKEYQIEVVEAHVPQSHPIAQAFWRALGATDYLHVVRYRL
ncbi:MAG: GNAT family N-acetyltransferase [Anaerolineae bacterium]|nr:GNAT family N-acetyltransferase [Anaerolineae bacterium]